MAGHGPVFADCSGDHLPLTFLKTTESLILNGRRHEQGI